MVLYFTTTLNNAYTHREYDTMLRITRNRSFRVSNRLAVLAALLLTVTAAAQFAVPFDTAGATGSAVATTERALPEADVQPNHVKGVAARKKGFKVRLYLFRR